MHRGCPSTTRTGIVSPQTHGASVKRMEHERQADSRPSEMTAGEWQNEQDVASQSASSVMPTIVVSATPVVKQQSTGAPTDPVFSASCLVDLGRAAGAGNARR